MQTKAIAEYRIVFSKVLVLVAAVLLSTILLPRSAWAYTYPVDYVYYTVNGNDANKHTDGSCTNYNTVVNGDKDVTWENGWYVVKGQDITIGGRITVSGEVNLILCDGANLTASLGITVTAGNTLNVYGQTNGGGTLVAGVTEHSIYKGFAGIGGTQFNDSMNPGTISIHGGIIKAKGGGYAAGIGRVSGDGKSGTITIYDGTVEATGGRYGAGIGGAINGDGAILTVYGGEVTATGGIAAAGIGGGIKGDGAILTVYGGAITATGGNSQLILDSFGDTKVYNYFGAGAGIGGGGGHYHLEEVSSTYEESTSGGAGGTVVINGGTVNATGVASKTESEYTMRASAGIGGGGGVCDASGQGFKKAADGNAADIKLNEGVTLYCSSTGLGAKDATSYTKNSTDEIVPTQYMWNTYTAPEAKPSLDGGSTTVATVQMLRLYNPNSGEHFYTASVGERDQLVSAGWRDEGEAWKAPENSSISVWRLYNKNGGDHHYTISAGERDLLVAAGWADEGVGWYSDVQKRVPVYRAYNPNATTGAHHFTTSSGEIGLLVTAGWNDEGIGFYAVE